MIPITRPSLPPLEEYTALLEQIWASRMLSNFATFSQQFEHEAGSYLEVPHALAVASCDVGLMVVLRALELPEGSPCFLSDFTFNSTINAALWCGLRPILVDVDPATYNMSPEALGRAMAKESTSGAVLATHVFGNPCDEGALASKASAHGSYLVFDAAHAYGSLRAGAKVGSSGDAEVFSFSGTKVVTSGEGGLITTRHHWLAERVRYLRAYGFQGDYRSRRVGINGKMSELHAALGLLSIRRIEELLARRSDLLGVYREQLGDAVGWQEVSSADRSTYKDLAVDCGPARAVAEKALDEAGVQTKRYFVPLHTMGPYARFADESLPVATALHERLLCLPLYPDLAESEVELVTSTLLAHLDGPPRS